MLKAIKRLWSRITSTVQTKTVLRTVIRIDTDGFPFSYGIISGAHIMNFDRRAVVCSHPGLTRYITYLEFKPLMETIIMHSIYTHVHGYNNA